MKKIGKRLLSVLLALTLSFSYGMTAFAGSITTVASNTDVPSSVDPMSGGAGPYACLLVLDIGVYQTSASSLAEAEQICANDIAHGFNVPYHQVAMLYGSGEQWQDECVEAGIDYDAHFTGGSSALQSVLTFWGTGLGTWNKNDVATLDLLFQKLRDVGTMSSSDYSGWSAHKNGEGSDVYYFAVFAYEQFIGWFNSSEWGMSPISLFYQDSYDHGFSNPSEMFSHYEAMYDRRIQMNDRYFYSSSFIASKGGTPDGLTEVAKANFVTASDGLNYYGRGYWGGSGASTVTTGNFGYSVEAEPKDKMANFAEAQYGEYKVHLTKGTTTIVPNATYTVDITTANSTNYPSQAGERQYGSWDNYGVYANGSGLSMAGYPGITVSQNAANHIKFNVTGAQLQKWCDGVWYPYFIFKSSASSAAISQMWQPKKFTVKISKGSSSLTCSPIDASWNGWRSDLSANFCSWKGGTAGEDIPWEFHTTYNPKAYAEIVANEAGNGNQDWNVMQGIPSTENLAVVAGGTFNMSDFSGYVHLRGTAVDNGTHNSANTGAGTHLAGAVERNINLTVSIEDTWGDANTPCSLSCPGHTESTSFSFSVAEDSDDCPHCGASVSATWTDPEYDEHGHKTADGFWTPKDHDCSLSITFDCSTGTWSGGGASTSTTGSSSLLGNGQRYTGSATATNSGGDSITVSVNASDLIDEGFTTGKGCVHSNNENMIHPGTHTYSYKVVETVDLVAWKEITSGAVYVLADVAITDVDERVVNPSAIGMTASSSTGQIIVWRGPSYDKATNLDGMAGRFYFTQFLSKGTVNSNMGDGFKGVEYNWAGHNGFDAFGYFLSDTDVILHTTASQKIANAANPGALDAVPAYGKTDGTDAQRNFGAKTSSDTTYQSGHTGDALTETQRANQALQIVNGWQYLNKEAKFTVIVLSDNTNNGSHWSNGDSLLDLDHGYQNMVNAIYAVDGGIALFNEPFTAAGQTHYRNHKSQYTSDQLKGMAYGAFGWQLHDGNAIVGYIGQPAENAADKYMYLGDSVGAWQTFAESIHAGNYIYGAVSNTDFMFSYDGSLEKTYTFPISKILSASDNGVMGVTASSWSTHDPNAGGSEGEWNLDTHTESFDGYYRKHTYSSKANNVKDMVDMFGGSSADQETWWINITDNGLTNVTKYASPYVISNIDLQDNAKNGIYSDAITVQASWRRVLDFTYDSMENGCTNQRDKIVARENTSGAYVTNCVYSDTYTNNANQTGVLNDIVIHDPITVESYGIIGNGYGSYAPGVVDETGEDMRIYTSPDGTRYTIDAENQKNNYIVMGNTFHIWASDFGDFRDINGSWYNGSASLYRGVGNGQNGANTDTGAINSNARGYVDVMNTGKWVKERYVQFEFPVSYIATDGSTKAIPAGQLIPLSDVKCRNATGQLGYAQKDYGTWSDSDGDGYGNWSGTLDWSSEQMHKASNALQNFKSNDQEFRYGLDYEFTLLPSALESKNAWVRFYVQAINTSDPDDCTKAATNKSRKSNYYADTCIYRETNVEIVGRIGNFAIEDVGDFRYSELFKKVVDYNSWLIPGVIHNVDTSKPNTILATKYDILGDDTLNAYATDSSGNVVSNPNSTDGKLHKYNHAQSSITNYIIGTTAGFGKAGNWLPLPLVASQNPVQEYKKEQMRMGYYAYLDVETMGNYYGVNLVSGTSDQINRGPTSVDDLLNPSFTDTRNYVIKITPKYYLYDMSNKKFYSINMYYGNQGSRTLFWKNGADISTDITSLYVNLDAEMGRRNTTEAERILTNNMLATIGPSLRASAFGGEDFIGTASNIVLDAYDRSYIGTPVRNGYISTSGGSTLTAGLTPNLSSYWFSNPGFTGNKTGRGALLSDTDFGQQQQRWYFTLGLPSSTYITYADDTLTNQAKIEQSHDKLMSEHPNSTVICYLDIEVNGTVWDLKYNAPLLQDTSNYPPLIPGEPFPQPDTPTSGIPVYKQDNTPDGTIPPEWQPVIAYDPEHTSAEDWDTYGTH